MARFAQSQIFRIMPETFDQIDDWIQAAHASGRNAQYGINALLMFMARTNQAFAMEMSAGPIDPHMQNRAAAWKIPVRRITSRYYKGWKVNRLAPNVWMMWNDSREAYFLEHGIHPTGTIHSHKDGVFIMRVRRPVQKLSLIRTLKFVDQSRVGERVWEQIYEPFRPGMKYSKRGHGIALSGLSAGLNDMAARGI